MYTYWHVSDSENFLVWLERAKQPRPGFRRTRRPSQIPQVLSAGEINIVYQPIVDMSSGELFAYEALVRSSSPHYQSPVELIAEAIRSNVCGAVGRIIREIATKNCPDFPLFLNIHPQEFDESWLVQPDDPIFSHVPGVFLEVTESVPLSHFALCHSVLKEIRSKGVGLAVDDLGAGYSNLKYITDLEPQMVKLDRSLVASIHLDRRRQVLVKHLVRLCEELEARVIAEGIETEDELKCCRDVGCHFAQGYYLARPAYPAPKPSELRF
ncbi:MAG: EAL domain-containing protein (putative c-di-GMP-specific phosphodiesterase class I) [Polyangiales bacterium]